MSPLVLRSLFFFLILFSLWGEEWNKVYLASFPRSGNHWVRFLVEEATHIATSSVYRDRDFPHLPTLFPWGGYCPDHGYNGACRYPTGDDPILLKTHYPVFQKRIDPISRSAICLIRHPIDAFWSFHIYRQKEKREGRIEAEELKQLIGMWRKFYQFWETQDRVLFVKYEDLQENTEFELTRILEAAGFSFLNSDIERAVAKYPSQGKCLKHIGRYDAESIDIIRRELADFLMKYGYHL